MRVRRLRLRNFRRYREADLELPDGVTALLGPNGAGKSTLLEALGFALFGPAATRTPKPLLRLEGAAPADPVEVEAELELGGQAIRILRELKGKALAPQATLAVDGIVVVPPGAGSSEAATGAIEKRLGLDRDAFFTTVVARQGELSLLADAKPADRKRLLLRMLGIDQVDAAVDRARQARRDADLRLEALRSLLPDPARLRLEAESAAAAHGIAMAGLAQAVAAEETARVELAAARAALDAVRTVAHARAAAEAAVRNAERVEVLCAQAARTAQARAQEARDAAAKVAHAGPTHEHLALAEEAGRVALAHEQARLRHAQAAQQVRQQAERVARLGPAVDLPALEASVEALAHEIEAAGHERAVAKSLQTELTARLHHLDHVGPAAACPTCEAPLGARLGTLLEGSRSRLDALARQLAALEPATQAKAQQVAALRRDQQRAEALARERKVLADLEALLPPDPGPVPDLLRIQREAALARQRHDERTRQEALAARLATLEQEEATASKAWQEAVAAREAFALASPPPGETGLKAAEQRTTLAEARERVAHLALQNAQAHLAQAEAGLAACRRREEEAAAGRAKEAVLEAEAREWGAVAGRVPGTGLLERFRDHLVGRVGPAIGHEAGRLLASFTGGRYTEVRLSEEYEVFVADGGTLYALERFSGGEQDLVHLALRLAVSRLLAERGGTEMRFLALDEVFGSLDRARRDLVVASLQQLGGLYAQVLVISHLEGLQEELGQALVVGEDAEGQATVTLHDA
ncbi:MAG: repair protein SbcC/Rad50 [Thermoplasmata archaeon]|jgi:exonuclease SbcC|nr:repair protein SbcC/Rad50 [Thermoplasmata archaeon]